MEEEKPINGPDDVHAPKYDQTLNTNASEDHNVPVDETTEVEQMLTTNLKSSNSNDMEVHHHAHDPAAPHHKKNWKSYFWEFLMLFLAVFCGFLAEYQLEHQIEKDREKQYMKSLLEDLSSDIIMINESHALAKNQKNIHDSILDMLYYHQPLTDSAIARLYRFHFSNRVISAEFEDRTKAQLKNSGGMRLIRKKNVSDSILHYWKTTENIDAIEERIYEAGQNVSNLSVKLFYTKYVIPGDTALSVPKGIRQGAELIDDDPKLLKEYTNRQYLRKSRIMVFVERSSKIKVKAERLMELIKKEYHLE